MITRILSKSKPINFLVAFLVVLIAVLISIFRQDIFIATNTSLTHLIFAFFGCILSVFLLDFIILKNVLSKKNNYETFLFSLFILTVPQVFFNYKIVLSNFLILLAIRRILSIRTQKETIKKLVDTGLLIGLAAIFHFWAILFFPIVFITLLLYAESEIKFWITPILGLLAIVIISIAYSLIVQDAFFSALYLNTDSNFNLSTYNSTQFIIVPILMLLCFGLWSSVFYLKAIKKKKKTYRESYKVIFLCCIIACVICFISPNKNGSEFLFLFAPLSIIISNYIETIKQKWFKELFLVLLIAIPFTLLML